MTRSGYLQTVADFHRPALTAAGQNHTSRSLEMVCTAPPQGYMSEAARVSLAPLRATMTIDEILENFTLLDDWEDRYRYVIELGKKLDPLPESERNAANKVRGCASQVWLSTHLDRDTSPARLTFRGDSDAHIVRGLIAIAITLFDKKTPSEILATDAQTIFGEIGLSEHLTAQRANGLRALVDRIRSDASTLHATT